MHLAASLADWDCRQAQRLKASKPMCVKGPVQYWYSTVLIVKVLQVCVRRRGPLVAPLALWPLEAPIRIVALLGWPRVSKGCHRKFRKVAKGHNFESCVVVCLCDKFR